jgi:hypothetical protein
MVNEAATGRLASAASAADRLTHEDFQQLIPPIRALNFSEAKSRIVQVFRDKEQMCSTFPRQAHFCTGFSEAIAQDFRGSSPTFSAPSTEDICTRSDGG